MEVITYSCHSFNAALANLLLVNEAHGAEAEILRGNWVNSVVWNVMKK